MFNKKENKIFKTVDGHHRELAVCCRVIVGKETNYLINIEGYDGGITALLDGSGNLMLSQVKL